MNETQFNELQETISIIGSNLGTKIDHLYERQAQYESRSHELNELFTALAKAQAEFETAGLTNANPFFKSKYADMAEIVRASRPALTKHGLSVTQAVSTNDKGQAVVVTMLGHSSGQCISSEIAASPAKPDVQSLGSCITYLRRYSYAALVGVVVSDEDDDGQMAVARPVEIKPVAPKAVAQAKSESQEPKVCITKEQLDMLHIELEGHTQLAQNIMAAFKIKTLSELPKDQFQATIKRIQDIKSKMIK